MKQKYEVLRQQAVELDKTINEYGPIVEAFFKRAFPHDEENMKKHLKTLENKVPRANILYQDIMDKLLSGKYKIKCINKIDELPKVLSPLYSGMIPKGWHAIANMYKLLYTSEVSLRQEAENKLKELSQPKKADPETDNNSDIADAICVSDNDSDNDDSDYPGRLDLKAESAKIIKKTSIDDITEDDYMSLILRKYVVKIDKAKGGRKEEYKIIIDENIITNTPTDYVNADHAEGVVFDKWIYIRHDHLEKLFEKKFKEIPVIDIIRKMAKDGNLRIYLHDEKLTRRIAHISHTVGPEEFYGIPMSSIKNYVIKVDGKI